MVVLEMGKLIRYHRKKSGLTQHELGKIAGVGKTVVFDVEKGKLSVRLDTLLKLFAVLNIRLKLDSPLMQNFEDELNEKS